MTPREALDRIAALCDGFEADGHGDAVSITAVRAVLAEVTPEPGGDMQSPLTRPGDMQSSGPESYKAGGVLDRDQARTILWDFADQVRQGWSTVNAVHSALDRLAAAVRPAVGGVTLTPEEAARGASVLFPFLPGDSLLVAAGILHDLAVKLGADLPPFEDEEDDE